MNVCVYSVLGVCMVHIFLFIHLFMDQILFGMFLAFFFLGWRKYQILCSLCGACGNGVRALYSSICVANYRGICNGKPRKVFFLFSGKLRSNKIQ